MNESDTPRKVDALLRWGLALAVILTLLAATLLASEAYQLLAHFGDVISIYFAAWVLQFLLAPLVDGLCKLGVRRSFSAVLVYLGLLSCIVVVFALSLPSLLSQLRDFADWLIHLGQRQIPSLTRNIDIAIRQHAPTGWQPQLIAAVHNVSSQLQSQTNQLSSNVLATAQSLATNVAPQTFRLLNTTLTVLFQLLVVVILSFFMTVEGRPFVRAGIKYLPRSLDDDVEAVIDVTNRAFGGFIRGQLCISALYGVLVFLVLEGFARLGAGDAAGQLEKLSAVAALLAALVMILPVIGTTLSMIPPIVIGAFALQDWALSIWLIAALWIVQLVMANIVGPRVMSDSVGVNALWTFAGLLIGGKIGGLLGAFFSVPILAAALTIAERIYLHLPQSKSQVVEAGQHLHQFRRVPPSRSHRHAGQVWDRLVAYLHRKSQP